MSTDREPRNYFYLLLLAASGLFVVTALATALVPVLEDKARLAGNPPPPSEFRARLRTDAWEWLLYEGAAVVVLSLLSMANDRLRRLKKERSAATIPPTTASPLAPSGRGAGGEGLSLATDRPSPPTPLPEGARGE